jgi:NAD(P)H-hydrate epimerase
MGRDAVRAITSDEMRRVEDACVDRGISLPTLMQRAGTAVAQAVERLHPDRPVLILAGPGNNGGDGLVAARALQKAAREVTVYAFHRTDLMEYSGEAVVAEEDRDLGRLKSLLAGAGVVVDALLGIGQNRAAEGLLASILAACDETPSGATRIAVDIPTGVDANNGAVLGPALRAHRTLCMGVLKVGAVVYPGAGYAGRAEAVQIGIPPDLIDGIGVLVPDPVDVADMLPKRSENSNKGTYGRLLVVAGSGDFMGAPGLVSVAALRAGAGLAEVASTADVCRNVASHALEPIYLVLPEVDHHVGRDATRAIGGVLSRVTAVVYGPGLGASDDVLSLTREVLEMLSDPHSPPAVIDADGLNALSRIEGWWNTDARLVLTPHPGEMSRLSGIPTAALQSNRLAVAAEHASRWRKTLALKGAGTIIADPSNGVSVNTTGSGNLATGGTGDVLSGIIGGLLAQGCDLWCAAVAGVYLHGHAGDLIAEEMGMSGTLAGDLLSRIPLARRSILSDAGVVDS